MYLRNAIPAVQIATVLGAGIAIAVTGPSETSTPAYTKPAVIVVNIMKKAELFTGVPLTDTSFCIQIRKHGLAAVAANSVDSYQADCEARYFPGESLPDQRSGT